MRKNRIAKNHILFPKVYITKSKLIMIEMTENRRFLGDRKDARLLVKRILQALDHTK